jgi:hypothetical protein
MKLYLRLFVECSNFPEARVIATRLSETLSKFNLSMANMPKQYWKLPELFEFTYELPAATQEDYDTILKCDGSDGWLHLDDKTEPCSVWNRSEGARLFIEGVTWAEVMLLP